MKKILFLLIFFTGNLWAGSVPAVYETSTTCTLTTGLSWSATYNNGLISCNYLDKSLVSDQVPAPYVISSVNVYGGFIRIKWWAKNQFGNDVSESKDISYTTNHFEGFVCNDLDYPTLDGEFCKSVEIICEDGYFSLNLDCSRPTPVWPNGVTVCLNGASTPPDWPTCESGLDNEFVRGVEDSANSTISDADKATLFNSQIEAFEYDISTSFDESLNAAANSASHEKTTELNKAAIDSAAALDPESATIANAANAAQTYHDTAVTNAAAALSAATDASVLAIQANQNLLDAQQDGSQVEIEKASAELAYAQLFEATTMEQAIALQTTASTAATSATSALNALTAKMDAVSNSVIPAQNLSSAAKAAAYNSGAAANSSTNTLNNVTKTNANGEVCVGDDCIAVPDEEDSQPKEPASYGDHGSSDYESFGEANAAFYTGLKNSALIGSFANVGSAVNFSGGSCTPLTIDLSMTIIGTSIGTDFNCSLFETNGMRDIISACMLILYGYCGFRIFVSA